MNVPLGDTYYFRFTTRSFSTGAPATLSGTPVLSVYEENNVTQITSGVSVSVDYDSVTGLNQATVVVTSGNGYEVGKYYDVVITTGTVGGVSVVGEVVGHFRCMAAEGVAGVPAVNVTHVSDSTEDIATETKQNTAQADLDIITGSDGVTLATAQGNYAPSVAGDSMALTAGAVDAIWDEAVAGHTSSGTTGWNMALAGSILVDTTITGTPTSTTLELTAGSAVDDFYNDQLIYIVSGTGIGQVRPVSDYTGATKTVTVDEAWVTTPAASDRVVLLSSHVHPKTQISAQVMADLDANGSAVIDELTAQGDTNEAAIAALNNLSAAEVNAEVLDVLQTDTFAELTSIPGATTSLVNKITFLFMLARNQLEQTATTATLRRDDTTTAVGTATVSDDGTTATKGEWS